MPNVLQNNKLQIFLVKVELFCLFVYLFDLLILIPGVHCYIVLVYFVVTYLIYVYTTRYLYIKVRDTSIAFDKK